MLRITLKAFANSSPRLRFGNLGEHAFISRRRNSERVASTFAYWKAVATPSESVGLSSSLCGEFTKKKLTTETQSTLRSHRERQILNFPTDSFRVARNLLRVFKPRVSKQTLGLN